MVLSIDLGATNIRIAEVNGDKIKNKKKVETPKTKKQILKTLLKLIESYGNPSAICIGIAGFVKNGKICGTPNMDFNDVNLKKILSSRYKIPVYIDNDANCAGLGELYYGRGKGKKNFVLLTIGTGIGGAIVINGRIYRGSGFAGEPGHMLINGKIFEKIASGKTYNEKMKNSLNEKQSIINEISNNLAVGILNISYILDPEVIILGGGFSNFKGLIKKTEKVFHKSDIIRRKIPVVHAKLKDDTGLVGAALLSKIKK
ncbi:hypothetical protein COU56_00790 [Candidatus Pacearchaeota archaeon CG10_big_fil_rev_8_21_14_0_10_31_9]|nr:MAG: hypothetical protein COU56_00790 [Candidatus Pacearchaeota archaeon CG10_big_fil_rev_8_21_14_0_10_31_9]PIZ83609.1 MAG: hypothetical protein COX97_00840 [Candidatus Pacearchaeota archaeon CG_4_10_14_0_2_um_filter_05_32_18]